MVMLIDDDEDDCDIFCDAISNITECKCHCISNSVEAISILDRAEKLPACIFLDINMPVMDGFGVLRRLKSTPRLASIPIVMYSTTPNPHEAEKSIQLGADRFVRKTSDYGKLIRLLKEIKSDLVDRKLN